MSPLLAVAGEVLRTESLVFAVLLQFAAIILAARLGAWLFSRLGQPQVVGEIAAGLLLGPSVFGRLAPELSAAIFPPELAPIFKVLSEVGLVFLMLLVGIEFEFRHLRKLGPVAVAVSVAGVACPFLLGLGLGTWLHPRYAPEINRTGFLLFVAVALSITAIPVLGRIMMEFGLTRTRLGVLTITAAAMDDATGWILLATVSAVVSGNFEPGKSLAMLAWTLGFVAAVGTLVRPLLVRWAARALARSRGHLGINDLAVLICAAFAAALVTNWIGIFSIFGPFVLGAFLADQDELRTALHRQLREFVFAFFLPIFFTYTGLRTNIGLLTGGFDWLACGLVFLAAIAGKLAGCGLASRLGGTLSWRESGCVAVMMNARGLMELIVINVGRDLGVIPDTVACMLVLMALGTTVMTSPLLRLLLGSDPPPAARPEQAQASLETFGGSA